jgi:hypothetical protein
MRQVIACPLREPVGGEVRRTLLVLLVLAALMVAAGAAGTPVNGDDSVAATTAGINLGHQVHPATRMPVAAVATIVAARAVRLLLLLVSTTWCLIAVAAEDRRRPVLWTERRPQRGPPLVRAL